MDQLWLNLLPVYFSSSTYISSDPWYNHGHWNLWQDKLTKGTRNYEYFFDERNVVILHFSGQPKHNLEHVTIHTSLYTDRPVWCGVTLRISSRKILKSQVSINFLSIFTCKCLAKEKADYSWARQAKAAGLIELAHLL